MNLEDINHTVIVSCQAHEGEPLHGAEYMSKMALAAKMGGAIAVRANGVADIRQIKEEVDVFIVGIEKTDEKKCEVFITPTLENCLHVAQAGADIIAIDATQRLNINKEYLSEKIKEIKKVTGKIIMADISTLEEAKSAYINGADIISTTLAGYTKNSMDELELPNISLIKYIREALPTAFINAEGRFETREQVAQAFQAGANTVTVGGAITRPQAITKKIIDYVNAVVKKDPEYM